MAPNGFFLYRRKNETFIFRIDDSILRMIKTIPSTIMDMFIIFMIVNQTEIMKKPNFCSTVGINTYQLCKRA